MEQDILILRELAARYMEAASDPVNAERVILHTAVNDKVQMRPVVLIDEIPWQEMNIHDELTICCKDPDYAAVEDHLRKELYKWRHMQADMILRPYYGVQKIVESTGIGVTEQHDEVRMTDPGAVTSRIFSNQITCEEDIEKLHPQVLTYREQETKALYEKISSAISDILPVKITGIESGYDNACKNWDDIAYFMGVDNLMYNLIDEPEMMHQLVARLTEINLDTTKQLERLGLYEPNQLTLHSTSALSRDLLEGADFTHISRKNVWGRGLAQIFSTVSKEMRDEYDIQYMKKALAPFGLSYYGCCEPLHNMIDILEQIPNLRKISITPWADVDIAADNMGTRYVMGFKPNPAFATDFSVYEEAIRTEIRRMLAAVKRNGTTADIVLKDISTVGHDPENLFCWEKLVMEAVREFNY